MKYILSDAVFFPARSNSVWSNATGFSFINFPKLFRGLGDCTEHGIIGGIEKSLVWKGAVEVLTSFVWS